MEITQLLNNGAKKLKQKHISTYCIDSEILLSKVLKTSREFLIIDKYQKISNEKINEFQKLIDRRSAREPIAYILQNKEFWSKNFFVNKNTLIPRPETELMVEKIIKIFTKRNISFLDIGTGTGCILLSIVSELKNSTGIGIDISAKAIEVAKINARTLKLNNRVKFYIRSFDKFFHKKLDLIVSNPPYIKTKDIKNLDIDVRKFEPNLALDGGNDGLDVIQKVIYKSRSILKIKGMLALEIGNGQFKKVSKILKNNKFKINYLIRDYKENIRCILSTFQN